MMWLLLLSAHCCPAGPLQESPLEGHGQQAASPCGTAQHGRLNPNQVVGNSSKCCVLACSCPRHPVHLPGKGPTHFCRASLIL